MQLKFYLNKFLKADGIENYTIGTLTELRKCYEEFLKKSDGSDPDFPMMSFGDKGETYTSSNNSVRNKLEVEKSQEN